MVQPGIHSAETWQWPHQVSLGLWLSQSEQSPPKTNCGSESWSQLLRRILPQAKYSACFDATSGFHQIRVDKASQDLLNIVTQMENFKFTVLGQGICSSGDLFNYITDGNVKLEEDFEPWDKSLK